MKPPKKSSQKSGAGNKTSPGPDAPTPNDKTHPKAPGHPATDRSAALADGLRHAHRDGDFNDKEYARQMQAITQEAAGIGTRESAG